MKVLAHFALLLVVAVSYPLLAQRRPYWSINLSGTSGLNPIALDYISPKVKTWTINEITSAVERGLESDLMPYLQVALSQIMNALYFNIDVPYVIAAIPSPSGQKNWAIHEIKEYLENPELDEEFGEPLALALEVYKDLKQSHPDKDIPPIPVVTFALDISTWHAAALKRALNDPAIRPELKIHINHALEKLELRDPSESDTICLVTPVGFIPNNPDYIEPAPLPELLHLMDEPSQDFFMRLDPNNYTPFFRKIESDDMNYRQ